jgi:Na+/H+ antiporter NhaC
VSTRSGILTFRGGLAGALAPFGVFLVGVAGLALAGAPDERGFWPVLLLALGTGLLLARHRVEYAESMLDGMSDRLVAVMILAWLLSGVIASLLAASGVVPALAELARAAGVRGGWYVGAAMLACALVSTATGTSFGTILLCGPLLYPAGAGAEAAPGPLAGAILAGATFGDSLSPISDTTIASSGTQGVDIPGTVRARLPYALAAGGAALLVLVWCGTGAGGSSEATPTGAGTSANPLALLMLASPLAVIGLLLRGRHLVEGLMAGIGVAIAVGLAAGLLAPTQLLTLDRDAFAAKGLLTDGLQRGVGVSVFTLLLMALVGPLRRSGVLDRWTAWVGARAGAGGAGGAGGTPRRTEGWIVATVTAAAMLTTHSVVAILAVGDVARRTGRAAGIDGYRRANLLDLSVCTVPFVLPYFLPPLLAAGTTRGVPGMPVLSPWEVGRWNAYAWGLMVVLAVAIVSGWGRGRRA